MVSVSQLGLCSVTLRSLPVLGVARAAQGAGLGAIEWGADVHAPADAPDKVVAAREAALAHGMVNCSYGSYFRAGPESGKEFAAVARAAVLLGAPRVRVWAGPVSSSAASSTQRRDVAEALREAADVAADHGLDVALEYHGGTLTDTPRSTVELLEEVGRPNLSTYWQPPLGVDDAAALETLEIVAPHVSAVHVFSWWPQTQRHALSYRAGLWRRVFDLLNMRAPTADALLEFVPDDEPDLLDRDAGTLRSLVGLGRS